MLSKWRSERDSNSRTAEPSNDLANRPLQPLEYHSIFIKNSDYPKVLMIMAGAVGLEPTTNGFGDHYSTN